MGCTGDIAYLLASQTCVDANGILVREEIGTRWQLQQKRTQTECCPGGREHGRSFRRRPRVPQRLRQWKPGQRVASRRRYIFTISCSGWQRCGQQRHVQSLASTAVSVDSPKKYHCGPWSATTPTRVIPQRCGDSRAANMMHECGCVQVRRTRTGTACGTCSRCCTATSAGRCGCN